MRRVPAPKQLDEIERLVLCCKDQDRVTIRITGGVVYKVPTALLVDTSVWFKKALSNGFKEAKEQAITFPAEDSDCVRIYLHWLVKSNGGEIKRTLGRGLGEGDGLMLYPEPSSKSFPGDAERTMRLIRAWMFGDAHFIPKFQNAVMYDLVIDVQWKVVDLSVVRHVFEETLEGSQLRKLYVEDISGWLGSGYPRGRPTFHPNWRRLDCWNTGVYKRSCIRHVQKVSRQGLQPAA